ncbi:amino acid ABC transporter membrane protein 1, PAAT family [Psychromonas ingrahamii 37]|uniref:Amino acid ABC transporter membrane protein 1, PAAT family n=1 Tax=Psychromonas ingrahamii (strain DSM 17664 / CCUG 51855 / 37) TaxID=357804 RepID=A1SS10_PSYIN|nr:amino acid ABC transporter permease [Psychromonas ingrahamii]ABM02275.1 amino acid ABC transporter membrane protein 1, PAAT family [Psychromonas ingrahamii 37]
MDWSAWLTLIGGAGVTVSLSLAAILLSLPLGLLFGVFRWQKIAVLNGLLAVYVTLIRSTPFVTLALFVFFGLPEIGIDMNPIPAAILVLTLNLTAFSSEIWRAALDNFSSEQLEAAEAYGMSRIKTFWLIIFPQLWRANLGPLTSEITILIKGTPAVAVIGVVEITRAASRIGAQTYDPLPPFLMAMILYTLFVVIIVKSQRLLEKKMTKKYKGGK